MRIDVLLFPGVQELDAIAPFEVLKNAAQCGADFDVRLVALSGPVEIVGTHGARIWAEVRFDFDSRPDVLVVPGGGWISRAPQGAGSRRNAAIFHESSHKCTQLERSLRQSAPARCCWRQPV